MPIDPVQVGASLVEAVDPTFTKIVLQVGTWNETDTTPQGMFDSQAGMQNVSTSNIIRKEATATWAVIGGQTPPIKGEVLVETNGATRKWVVTEISSSYMAEGILHQTGTLLYDATLAAAIA